MSYLLNKRIGSNEIVHEIRIRVLSYIIMVPLQCLGDQGNWHFLPHADELNLAGNAAPNLNTSFPVTE